MSGVGGPLERRAAGKWLWQIAGEGGPCVGAECQGDVFAVFGVADQDGGGGVGDFYAVAAVGV